MEAVEGQIAARDKRLAAAVALRHETGVSTLAIKANTQPQPDSSSGAPKIPGPSSCFTRQELERIQACFLVLSQVGGSVCLACAASVRCLMICRNSVT